MSKKLTVLLLLSLFTVACGKVPIERDDPATAQILPDEPDTPDPEPEPDTDETDQANVNRLSSKIDEFIDDVEEELTPASDPNLSGIWLSVWANFGVETGTRNGQSYEATFEGFGFDVAYIDDDGAGTLYVLDCYADEGNEIFYDENDELSNDTVLGTSFGGDIVDSNHLNFDVRDYEESGVDPDTGESFTATGTYINKFTKLSNNFTTPIGTLISTSTAGSTDLDIICTSYLENEYTEDGNTNKFFAFIDDEFDVVDAADSEDDISISRDGENITLVAGDDDPDEVFIFEYSFD